MIGANYFGHIYPAQSFPSYSVAWMLSVSDTVSFNDATAKIPGSFITDPLALSDALAKHPRKNIQDALSLADALIKAVGLARSDALICADALALLTGKTLEDNFNLADGMSLQAQLTVADTITLADLADALHIIFGGIYKAAFRDGIFRNGPRAATFTALFRDAEFTAPQRKMIFA